MKKIFLQNKYIVLVLFLALAVFSDSFRRPLVFIFSPFIKLGQSINDWRLSDVQKENYELKTEIEELKTKLLSYQPSSSEGPSFAEAKDGPSSYILASIVSRPPQAPYDILLLDAGAEHGVKPGMTVTAYENVLLGFVIEVFADISKVKLISFPGEETNVMIQGQVSAIAIGRGGENLEIKLPSAIEIKLGDQIMAPGTFPLLVGVVEKVEINLSDPFQKILFRLPINLQYLKYLMVEK
ncbi:MAG: rod shape-determining protein MreC [Candidatus Terrybacteria bacterium]|nr:rod shape-determining protein MreC [Candidatus Terrybacteria bacterium]MBI4812052.1 rod shape-determining protein MreC [Candidatus Falkowbacteria bacterium]